MVSTIDFLFFIDIFLKIPKLVSSCYLFEFVIDNVSSSAVRNAPILLLTPIGLILSPD